MEAYGYSYPDSGNSSPRSHRDIDFDSNPPPSWEDQPHSSHPPPPQKVKVMVSYGGKIQPRPHDNQLSYVGGETKILSFDRFSKFPSLLSKLSSLLLPPTPEDTTTTTTISSFKYQLPGEDLDALISVTNDDDLDHMLHEYDRLSRSSSKPARLRLFAFPNSPSTSAFPDPVPVLDHPPPPPPPPPLNATNNVDFLFGLENRGPAPPQHVAPPDPQIDARLQDLNRIHISDPPPQHHQPIYRPKTDDNLVGSGGFDYQKPPPTIPASVQIPAGYWQQQPPPLPPQQQQQQQQFEPPPQQQQQQLPHQQQYTQQQPVYMVHHAPPQGSVYQAPPVVRTPPLPQQGYYQQVYREQPVYSVGPPPTTLPPPTKIAGYSEGMGVPVRPVAGENNTGYAQVAYDSATGRQVYYAAPGGVTAAPFSGAGGDGKGVHKVSPTSNAV